MKILYNVKMALANCDNYFIMRYVSPNMMEIHQQVDMTIPTGIINETISLVDQIVLADNIIHIDPSIHLVTCEGKGGYVTKR